MIERAEARRLMGGRLPATGASQKTLAHRMGLSPQRVGQHVRGECASLPYEQLEKLARCDLTNALAVTNGGRVMCETAALEGKSIPELLEQLSVLLEREVEKDGLEDMPQQALAVTAGTMRS